MKTINHITPCIFLILLSCLTLACGGGGQAELHRKDTVVKVRFAGKENYNVIAYKLGTTPTGENPVIHPGEVHSRGTFSAQNQQWILNLSANASYRIRLEAGGVEILETIVLSGDLQKANNNVLNIGAINGATTYLVLRAIGQNPDNVQQGWADILAQLNLNPFQDFSLARVKEIFANNAEALDGVRLTTIVAGMMTLRTREPAALQSQWDNVALGLANFLRSDGANSSTSQLFAAIAEIGLATTFSSSQFDAGLLNFFGNEDPGIILSTLADFDPSYGTLLGLGKVALEGKNVNSSGNAETQDLVNAFKRFSEAKALEPYGSEGLFFSALTRIASMPFRDGDHAQLPKLKDALHVPLTYTNNDNIDYSTRTLLDISQYTDLPTPGNLKQGTRNVIIQDVDASISDLKKITFLDVDPIVLYTTMQGDVDATSDVHFDRADIQAMLCWLYTWRFWTYHCIATDYTIAGRTDTADHMKQFLLDVDDAPMFSGNVGYSGTASISSADTAVNETALGSQGLSFSTMLTGSFPGILLDGTYELIDVDDYGTNEFKVDYDYQTIDGSYRFENQLNGILSTSTHKISGNVRQYVYNKSTGSYLGSRTLSLIANASGTGLSEVSSRNLVTAANGTTFVNNNAQFLGANQDDLNQARTSLQLAMNAFSRMLDYLQVDRESGKDRGLNMVGPLTNAKKEDGNQYSNNEINDFQDFLSTFAQSFDAGGALVDPRLFDSSLSEGVVHMDILFNKDRGLRYYLTDASGSANTLASGNLDFNDQKAKTIETQIAGGTDSATHLFGQNLESLSDEFGHVGTSMAAFLENLETPQNVALHTYNGHKLLTWDEVDFATGYKVYYAHESGVTPSGFQNLTDSGSATISGGNVNYIRILGLASDLTDVPNGNHYFVVTATNGTQPLTRQNDGSRQAGSSYESAPSTQFNDSSSTLTTPPQDIINKISGLSEFSANTKASQ